MPWWKRFTDVFVSGSMLLVLSPLLALIATAIKLTSPGPVIFRQRRAGVGGRPFDFFKFRSMTVDAEEQKEELRTKNEQRGPIFKMRQDPRITGLGRLLRRTSLDELPQLWNVLRGDMSLVGPRPPTLDEVPNYKPWQLRRLFLTGGLTCSWQVSGRSEIGFEDWVRMDIRYAANRSFLNDLRLIARTPAAMVTGRGAY
jgi:lipopolysaccharide/colanic/teichoic acid biosynthesis glycosyltransferase